MKITNNNNLPEPLVAACSVDFYSKGDSDFSTTGLLRPARIVALENLHQDELQEDVMDRIYRLTGQTKHVVLERAALSNPDYLVERRFFSKIHHADQTFNISGQLDLYDPKTKTLYDWKETSVWKEILGDKDDWIAQGNINAWILADNGIPVERIVYITFYRDWKKRDSFRDDYPKNPVGQYDFGELWTPDRTVLFIKERINAHLRAKEGLPDCTPEERWERPAKWAVKKSGGVRATKVFDVKQEAESFVRSKAGYEVEFRPPEFVRCESYCPVSEHCSFFQSVKGRTRE